MKINRLIIACLMWVLAVAQPLAAAPPVPALVIPTVCETAHDGDTATFTITFHVQVRYVACWAPELTKPGGAESAASAKQAEGKHGRLSIPLNDPLELWKIFTFGRVLGEFWPDGATESESERQVRLGFAGATKDTQPTGPPVEKK